MTWPVAEENMLTANDTLVPGVKSSGGSVLVRSLEARVLEKHGGQWKIAYLGDNNLPKVGE